jgi:hypothetical protein
MKNLINFINILVGIKDFIGAPCLCRIRCGSSIDTALCTINQITYFFMFRPNFPS